MNGLVGFINLGNTCFMNSALQCLSHCEDLTKYFLLEQHKYNITPSNDNNSSGEIAMAYYKLIKELWLGQQSVLNPIEFKGIFGHFVQQFADHNQHDSQEVLTFILDKIHEDLNKVHHKPYIEMNSHNNKDTDKVASDKWWKQYKKREDSIIVDLFHGQFKNKIACSSCNYISITFDPFVFLSLPIPSQNYFIQYKFFPLIQVNYINHNLQKKHKKKKSNYTTSLLYQSYDLSLTNRTILNDFITSILKHNPELNKNNLVDFDFIILKPNKQYHKLITSSNQLNELFHNLLNGYEMCIYEKQDTIRNVYVYPCDFVQINKWFIIPATNVQFLSYPLAIPIKGTEHVNDLYNILNTCFKSILVSPNEQKYLLSVNQLNEEESKYSHCYRLFLYNTKHNNTPWVSLSNLLKYLNDYEMDSKSIHCDYCGNSKCYYCNFLDRFKTNESFEYIYSICSSNTPLIIYAQIFDYDRNKSIYSNRSIPLPINNTAPIFQNKVITIYDCLDLFTTEEYLEEDNKWYCPKCKMHQEANKKLDFFTLPPYLIIQLKRFQIKSGFSLSYGKKNFTFVDFPLEDLDLSNYIQSTNKEKMQYDLIAISEHYGQLSSGHYISECKNNENWYEFDDDAVSKKIKEKISKSAAYILFYKQRSTTN